MNKIILTKAEERINNQIKNQDLSSLDIFDLFNPCPVGALEVSDISGELYEIINFSLKEDFETKYIKSAAFYRLGLSNKSKDVLDQLKNGEKLKSEQYIKLFIAYGVIAIRLRSHILLEEAINNLSVIQEQKAKCAELFFRCNFYKISNDFERCNKFSLELARNFPEFLHGVAFCMQNSIDRIDKIKESDYKINYRKKSNYFNFYYATVEENKENAALMFLESSKIKGDYAIFKALTKAKEFTNDPIGWLVQQINKNQETPSVDDISGIAIFDLIYGNQKLSDKLYSERNIKIKKLSSPITEILQELEKKFEDQPNNLICDSNTSDYSSRYYSTNIFCPSFSEEIFPITNKLSYELNQKFEDLTEITKFKDLGFNFIPKNKKHWGNYSLTIGSSRITSHIHKSPQKTIYTSTLVIYPKIPSNMGPDDSGSILITSIPSWVKSLYKVDASIKEIKYKPIKNSCISFAPWMYHETISTSKECKGKRSSLNIDFFLE